MSITTQFWIGIAIFRQKKSLKNRLNLCFETASFFITIGFKIISLLLFYVFYLLN